ncbi:cob(I)yrinic acid a,c-diamide adenosyltransferase [Castellaniella sp. MT123]|uniref:cob(I)yrinic acid a,c-diamide adenosyltransferase n=1 Tax=Castellaniella sp. MT123 TaxID=3140381 RepID=UPI0031F38F7D|nr:cob(I)yrinic acid a,c-diamide adenosyltransferase [Castellaniella sp.]
MSIRVSIVSTRTGDDGTTGLGDKTRVPKDAPRITALGNVDELNSAIGVWRTHDLPEDVDTLLSRIQNDLFDLGGELCIPGWTALNDAHILRLDEALAHYNAGLGPLQEFILPGGCPAAAQAHMARTIARRAERSVVTLAHTESVNPPVLHYLNRLSDLCFVLARHLNRESKAPDVLWMRQDTK